MSAERLVAQQTATDTSAVEQAKELESDFLKQLDAVSFDPDENASDSRINPPAAQERTRGTIEIDKTVSFTSIGTCAKDSDLVVDAKGRCDLCRRSTHSAN